MIRGRYLLIGIFIFLHDTNGQGADTTCLGDQPFKSKKNICSNFTGICIKTEDPDCKSFLQSCSQCPPSNITTLSLINLLTSSKDLLTIAKMLPLRDENNARFLILEKKLSVLEEKVPELLIILYVIVILLILLLLVLLIEIRFKLITKCLEQGRTRDSRNYRILDSRKHQKELNFHNQNTLDMEASNNESIELMKGLKNEMEIIRNQINAKIETKLENITSQLKNIFVSLHSTMKFKMKGATSTKMIELKVNTDDNIVVIKRQICAKLNSSSPYDYKIMKLEFNGITLDDNQFILSCVDSPSAIIDWVILDSINHKDIVVIRAQGKSINGLLIQIGKDQKIMDLKSIIHKLSNQANLMLLFDSGQLQDEWTIAECDLIDDSLIKIVEKNDQKLVIEFVFIDHQPQEVKYLTTDTVWTLKTEISKELQRSTDEFELMFENEILHGDSLIIGLEIASGSIINCFPFQKFNNVSLVRLIGGGNCSEIHKAKHNLSNTELYLKRYKFGSVSKFLAGRTWKSELAKIKLTKSHPRFGQIKGFYMDDRIFCVEIDYFDSMINILENGFPFVEAEIAKWSKQILESMKFLHDLDIILLYMKISDIFVDGYRNVVMSGFGLSKYLNDDVGDNFLVEIERKNISSFPLMPPEVMHGKPFDKPTDVWLFGFLLHKIVTNRNPSYPIKGSATSYDNIMMVSPKHEISSELKFFVESCLKGKPEDRLTVNGLLEDDFIKQYE